jgi:dTDP-4-dehydrorhamnose reductase
MGKKSTRKPEIWGGIECSFNRVKDQYMDQLQYGGHYDRVLEDVEAIAALGIRTVRYPLIWERLHPSPGSHIDWNAVATPLNALRKRGVVPIAGLVHHGSGPRHADLLSDRFAPALAEFAGAVAEAFPWIEYYTPVNEPLTTARFSCLYGLWFPHRRSDRAFARAFINEMKGVVLSMKEIRRINPGAKLVQTEDLAKIYSTARLKYQADFENHRRWLSWDILCGKVTRYHPLWEYFVACGILPDALQFFVDNPCPPDIIGVDYYATSERYLDEALDKYPAHTHGSNHFERYADVEAFRVRHSHPCGIKQLLKETWERYHLPIAVTEVHINCDFDNQIRWFGEIRDTCVALINKGVDIRSVTAWALFGSYGWNALLTKANGDYESGAFDVRTGVPIATPVAEYLANVIRDPDHLHPAQSQKGWWRREDRFIFERGDAELIEEKGGDDCHLRGDTPL